MHIVIIGAGIAGTTAAAELRKLEAEAQITLIGNEAHPLYSRVMLPHYISGKVPRDRVFLKKLQWYKEQQIDYVIDPVVSIDTKAQTVTCASEAVHAYDKLLIAGGGDVRKLPFDQSRIFHLQTIDDADRIVDLKQQLSPSSHVAIIGGGFIAMEFLNIFHELGVSIDLYLRGKYFFSRTFDAESSHILEHHLKSKGVVLHKEVKIADVSDDGTISPVEETPRTYDAIGAGIGLDARFAWLKDSGVRTNTGILCDAHLFTGVRNVWTAGDCAEYEDLRLNTQMHVGNWMNAQMQGRYVAQSMTGKTGPFDLVSSYATDVLDIDIIAVGDASHKNADRILVRAHEDGRTLLFVDGDRVRGASMINANSDRAGATRLIKEKTPINGREHKLQDASIPLTDLL